MDKTAAYKALEENPDLRRYIKQRAFNTARPADPAQAFIWDAGYAAAFQEIQRLHEAAENERLARTNPRRAS